MGNDFGFLFLAGAALSQASLASSTTAATNTTAATKCTAWCSCDAGQPCQCHGAGGSSGSCVANGGDCNTTACSGSRADFGWIAADGSVLALGDVVPGFSSKSQHAIRPPLWSTESPGHAVARLCNGVIVAVYYDHAAAESVRAASRHVEV